VSHERADPQDVLTDLFDSEDLPLPNPEEAAAIVIQRLTDAGFEIRPAEAVPSKPVTAG
jgi:hypothetical protein